MENIFQKLGEILKPENPQTLHLKIELSEVLKKIEPLERAQNGGYTSDVAKSFHLGMVGGSGRNTYRLNKRREREMEKTIERAVILCNLYKKRDGLLKQIEDIESGAAEKRELSIIERRIKKAEMWKALKVGDELPIGNNNGNPVIKKKNRLSVETEGGVKWMASEVIGRDAAKFL